MREFLIKPSTFAYLNQWHILDRDLVDSLMYAQSIDGLAEAIREVAIKYQVIRSFEINRIREAFGEDEVNERWRQVAGAVKAVRLGRDGHPRVVHDLADKLGSIFQMETGTGQVESSLISAATKFLWFYGHSTIRIYDKRAVDALNMMQKARAKAEGRRSWLVGGDYDKYSRAWQQEFLARKTQLAAAIAELPQQVEWSFIPAEHRASALKESTSERFMERVFDKYLWVLGERKKKRERFVDG